MIQLDIEQEHFIHAFILGVRTNELFIC